MGLPSTLEGLPILPHTTIRRRPAVMYRITHLGSKVELRFHGKTIPFPGGTEDLVKYIAESQRWTPADLPGLPPNYQQAIARQLSDPLCAGEDGTKWSGELMRMGRLGNVIVLLGWSVTRSPSTVPWQGRFQAHQRASSPRQSIGLEGLEG